MKVAITGVSGYLGAMVARKLDADPEVESILGLDIIAPKEQTPKMTFSQADVRSADFEKILAGQDVVYHLAFIVEPPKSLTMEQVDEINITGSRRVFEGAIEAGVPKIIYASSMAAYGAHPDNPVPLYETTPLRSNHDWYYSRTKGAVEKLLDEIQDKSPDTIIIRLRPCIFLGPTVNNSIGKSLTGRVLLSLSKDLMIDLCWDEDIVEAFYLVLQCDHSDVFNLAGDGALTMHEMGKLLGKPVLSLGPSIAIPLCKLAVKLKWLPLGMLEWLEIGMSGPFVANTDKAKKELGWQPQYDAAQTLIKFATHI